MMLKRDKRGFTIMGLLGTLFAITLLAAVVGGIIYAFYSAGRTSSLEGDERRVQSAVYDYVTESSAVGNAKYPTSDGSLPASGQYAPMNFMAGFRDAAGNTIRFYPHFLKALPRHWNDDPPVWLIDSEANVSVDMEPEGY